jgi:head-tail adaptor
MGFLSAGQLSYMRTQVLETMPDTGTILAGSITSDGQGGNTMTWAGTTAIDCRVDVTNGREQVEGGGYKSYQKTQLTLPYNAVITVGNRFAYLSDQYNVVAVSGQDRSWNITVRAELEKV